jgi:hypothetical protein
MYSGGEDTRRKSEFIKKGRMTNDKTSDLLNPRGSCKPLF